jgi:beta-phosphoglucomutase-like phosphatase (HAD superfamily)
VYTAAVVVVEAPSVTGVQRLLTTHLGASLAARVLVLSAVASADEGARWVSPQAMLAAAERVSAEPHRCVVIAHDAAGVDSARCAGMRVVCVPSQVRPCAVVSVRVQLRVGSARAVRLKHVLCVCVCVCVCE